MEFIILFLIIFTISMTITNILNKRIEEIIPITVTLITIVVYIAGLFEHLNIGFDIVIFLSIASFIYNVFFLIKKAKNREIRQELEKILTPGMLLYIIIFLLCIFINRQRILEDYDDFNHWGLILKNMFMYNGYGTVNNSIVTFNEYPPFTATFQYILLKIKGSYSEELALIAQNLLYLSFMIPISKNIRFKKTTKNLILCILTIILVPIIYYKDFYTNLLVDGLLGVFFAIGLFMIYQKDENSRYKNTMFVTILISLTLTKTTGLFFALWLVLLKLLNDLLSKKSRKRKALKSTLLILLLPIILTGSWYLKVATSNHGTEWNFNQAIQFEHQEKDTAYIVNEYVNAFFSKTEFTPLNLSLFCCILISIGYSLYIYKRQEKKQAQKYSYIMIGHSLALILFLIGLLWMYLTIFIEYEANILACYTRYTSTMLLSWAMLNNFILCNDTKIKTKTLFLFLVVIILFLPMDTIKEKYIHKKEYITYIKEEKARYVSMSKYKQRLNENDKIFFLSNVLNPFVLKINKYEFMDLNIANKEANVVMTKEQFLQMLIDEKYTYIYVWRTSMDFRTNYKSIFENEDISNETLYQIVFDLNKNTFLRKVG